MSFIDGKRLLMTGKCPPPVGGVSVFIRRFLEAAEHRSDVEVKLFNIEDLCRLRFDVLLVNSSNKYKRLFFVLLARLIGKDVYVIKHGGAFDLTSKVVRLSLKASKAIFCLNSVVEQQLKDHNFRYYKHTTIFRENKKEFYCSDVNAGEVSPFFTNEPVALFYINNNSLINGDEVYGATFVAQALSSISESFRLIVVDLSGSYRELFEPFEKVYYTDEKVDFLEYLKRVDLYIRPTSTDGDSVAILEAGLLGVKCLASDVVDRPDFVTTYKFGDVRDFCLKVLCLLSEPRKEYDVKLSSVNEIIEFIGVDHS